MRPSLLCRALALAALLPTAASAQALSEARTGPAIPSYGPVYSVEDPDFPVRTDAVLRVVWDVREGAAEPDQLNRRIETVARYLNMHAQAGVPRENMKAALVLHGTAGKDALSHEGYRARLGVDNPNLGLLEELAEFGVQIILCGQTQQARGLPRDQLSPVVHVALSAMTAHVELQSQGYRLIPF